MNVKNIFRVVCCIAAALAVFPAGISFPADTASIAVSVWLHDTSAAKWTVMVYVDGDNENESSAVDAFLNISSAGSSGDVNVLVQMDRGGFDARYGGWSTAKRFLVENALTPDSANALEDIGEVNMGSPAVLRDFVEWGIDNYPAENYAIFLCGPGKGGWSRAVGMDGSAGDDGLSVQELGQALDALTEMPELVVLDASCAGMIELIYELKDRVPVVVASQVEIPLPGLPYEGILDYLLALPDSDGAAFAEDIVGLYAAAYPDEGQLAAIDSDAVSLLADRLTDFAAAVTGIDDDWLTVFHSARTAASCPVLLMSDVKAFLSEMAMNAENASVRNAAQDALDVFDPAIISSCGIPGDDLHGLSLYFARWGFDVDSGYNDTLEFVSATDWSGFLDLFTSSWLVPEHTGEHTCSYDIAGGTEVSSYVMLSFPVVPDEADVLKNIESSLGEYNPVNWRLFRWDSQLVPPAYREINAYGENVVPGQAYWLISRDDANIGMTGLLLDTDSFYAVDLLPGWNQIGSPFNFNIEWDVFAVSDGVTVAGVTSQENSFTSHTLWEFEGNDYSGTNIMEPGKGYWLRNLAGYTVQLIAFPAPVQAGGLSLSLKNIVIKTQPAEEKPPAPPGGTPYESDDDSGDVSFDSGGGCFIATACFGSPMAEEVVILKKFRDKHLLKKRAGRLFVRLYYRFSPPAARFISSRPAVRAAVRGVLKPLISFCRIIN